MTSNLPDQPGDLPERSDKDDIVHTAPGPRAGVPAEDDRAWTQYDAVIILSNAPDMLLAKRIAHVLVEEHYAACVNLGAPGLSMYMWEGKLEGAEEVPITIKTTGARAPAAMDKLRELHPYEVPELIVLPVLGGSAAYIQWMREQTLTDHTR